MENNQTNFAFTDVTFSFNNAAPDRSDSSSTRNCASDDTGYNSGESGCGKMNSAVAENMQDWMEDEDDSRTSVVECISPCHESGSNSPESNLNDGDESLTSLDASETIDCMIDFLQEKQILLQRAGAEFRREENYAAATALKYANSDVNKDGPNSIWTLAKELKQAYYITSADTTSSSFSSSSSTPCNKTSSKSNLMEVHADVVSPKHPEIDLSTVVFRSTALNNETATETTEAEPENDSVSDTASCIMLPSFLGITWIAKAFVAALTSGEDVSQTAKWRRVYDPITGSLGLLPPKGVYSNNMDYMTLDDAVGLVSEARLVVHSTPPFRVVFANRAFLQMYNTGRMETVVGKPIESIIYEISIGAGATDQIEEARPQYFLQSNDRPCSIHVTPVVDRSKRPKVSVQNTGDAKSTSTTRISHILVSVSDIVDDRNVKERLAITAVETKYDSTPPDSSAPFGTVG
jgi:hypothetical protein